MLRKRVTVSYLSNGPTLSSWSRKDTAVHVSLSSDSNVKQRIIRRSFRSRQKQVSSRLTGQDVNARRSSRNTGSRRPHRAASPSVGAVYAGGPDLSTRFVVKPVDFNRELRCGRRPAGVSDGTKLLLARNSGLFCRDLPHQTLMIRAEIWTASGGADHQPRAVTALPFTDAGISRLVCDDADPPHHRLLIGLVRTRPRQLAGWRRQPCFH